MPLAGNRLLKGVLFNAEQAQQFAPPPYSQDEVPGDELGGVRCRSSASRQFDVMGHSGSTGWLAGGPSDDPWRAVHLLRASNRNGHDVAPGISSGVASNRGADGLHFQIGRASRRERAESS